MSAGGDLLRIITTLIRRRHELGRTQADVAGALGVSKQSVFLWETYRCTPETPRLFQWASELGVSLKAEVQA